MAVCSEARKTPCEPKNRPSGRPRTKLAASSRDRMSASTWPDWASNRVTHCDWRGTTTRFRHTAGAATGPVMSRENRCEPLAAS